MVTLAGDFDLDERDHLNDAFDTVPEGDLQLDLRGVTFCSSTTLTCLLRLRQHVIRRGDTLELLGLSHVMHRLLIITGTHHLFLQPANSARSNTTHDLTPGHTPGRYRCAPDQVIRTDPPAGRSSSRSLEQSRGSVLPS